MLIWSIIIPVFFLSLAPHQEARFLVPLLPAVCLYAAKYVSFNSVHKIFFRGEGKFLLLVNKILFEVKQKLIFFLYHHNNKVNTVQHIRFSFDSEMFKI